MNLIRQAIKAWPHHDLASRQQINALRRGYIKARRILGLRYLLAVPVQRRQAGNITPDMAVFITVCACAFIGHLL